MNKVLVITGANTEVGFATVKLFVEQGYKVISLSSYRLSTDNTIHLTIDLTDINWPLAHCDTLQTLLQDAQSITLVHNATLVNKDIQNVNTSILEHLLQINVITSTQLNQLLLPLMKPSSCILYIDSTINEKPAPNLGSYIRSKRAQVGLMQATCQDLIGYGIHTACICPELSSTQPLKQPINHHSPKKLRPIAKQAAFKCSIISKEIAGIVKFCAENPSINGSVIQTNLE